jgi:hypothetical protein
LAQAALDEFSSFSEIEVVSEPDVVAVQQATT